jgi:glucose dehydrogenase
MVKKLVLILMLLCGTPVFAQTNWATFGFDHERTGYNPQESTLSVANVTGLTSKWSTDLGATITAQPVLANNLLYAATGLGKVYALDPVTGAIVWSVQLGTQAVDCSDFIDNTVGVIGTPTIDPINWRIFVVSGDDLLHDLDLTTGNELLNYPLQLMGPDRLQITLDWHRWVGSPVSAVLASDDPVLNLVYTGNTQDDGIGVFFHGIIALAPQADCTLASVRQKQVGINGGVGLSPYQGSAGSLNVLV